MNDRPFISQFSPQWTDPKFLEAILVQREDLLAESVSLIRESVLTANKHHLLFIGSRGAGKSHLVTLMHHRLTQDAVLTDKMRFAWLNEDETATSFLRLLVLIYRSLSERYPAEFPASTITDLAGQQPRTAQDQLGQALLRDLGKRTVVLIVENLDSLFRHLSTDEQLNWRAFVQNHPVFATIGTAQALFDGVSDGNEPFFGFFDTRHLQPLSVEEARSLLEKIATLNGRDDLLAFLKTPVGHARVAAIRALAGGNPRLYLIFSELLTQARDLDDLVRPFEEMVDRQLTSYYQERLRWLSPQQREIIQFLCRDRHPVPVKRIAEGLFTTHNSITGQLKQLREMRYLDSHPIGREVLYELAEPLMRLALQVKETHDRRPLALIVDFLRVWHEREEIEARLSLCGPLTRGHAYYTAAKAFFDSGAPNLRHEYLRHDLDLLPEGPCDDATIARVRATAEDLDEPAIWIKLGTLLNAREEWDEAIRVFTHIISADNTTPAEVAKSLFRRGYSHSQAGRGEEAIADYTRVIELPGAPAEQVAWALFNRGLCHGRAGRREEAIADLTRAIDLPGTPAKYVAWALIARGGFHAQAGRGNEAIADCTHAIELPEAFASGVAIALSIRGHCHRLIGPHASVIRDFSLLFGLSEQARIEQVVQSSLHHIASAVVEALFAHTHDPQSWKERIAEFLRHFARFSGLAELGDALVKHLPKVAESPLNHAAWDAWVESWETCRAALKSEDQDHLEIPLRLLRTGIDYLKTKEEGRLLVLPAEERKVLRDALGLPEEK
ncbi:MAG: hypothetical protein ACKVY0_16300 [Prosthecobacter sp.]|uniref:hypothetical protein n=1 Tax=Prosthecobacter sp. TaxID=1965333 RepID=UPI0039001595